MNKRKSEIILATCLLVIIALGISIYIHTATSTDLIEENCANDEPVYVYGYEKDQYFFEKYPIKSGSVISDLLLSQNISFPKIVKLENNAEDIFSLRKFMAGKEVTFIKKDECDIRPESFVYQPNPYNYYKYDLKDSMTVTRVEVPFETCVEVASGTIHKGSSLYQSMVSLGLGIDLIDKMEDALAQVYFFSSQPDDQYKLIFERKYIDNKPVGIGQIIAAAYRSNDSEYYGIYYENDQYKGYYDNKGTPNKKTFLRAPVKYSRISSFYTLRRFHPVLKRNKPHYGTDYAARRGTPIFAVADGVITRRSYTRNNGNYVKMRHDNVYETQYLHMSKFRSGQKVGSRVKQGDVIGYVGKTGLATGNHVCFRFWKNGRQINHLRENFPPRNPLPEESLDDFMVVKDSIMYQLNSLSYTDLDQSGKGAIP